MKNALILLALILTACAKPTEAVNHYGYAPSIIYQNGIYYAYFCSSGTDGWDAVRLTTSTDHKTWSDPIIVLTSPGSDRAACDPSVVYFKGYYYLYYTGNILNVQSVVFVSRSASLNGPFLKYGKDAVWGEMGTMDPKPLILPSYPTNDGPGALYGAGQQTVVARGDTLFMWYTDRTPSRVALTLRTSTDGINWSELVKTNVDAWSVDVKFNTKTNEFNMFGITGGDTPPVLTEWTSKDGMLWTQGVKLHDIQIYSHNAGVSGNERGELLGDSFIGYGAPRNFETVDNWPNWDMYAMDLQTFDVSVMVHTR